MAQVSINIGDVSTTPMHVVYEECVKDAKVSCVLYLYRSVNALR